MSSTLSIARFFYLALLGRVVRPLRRGPIASSTLCGPLLIARSSWLCSEADLAMPFRNPSLLLALKNSSETLPNPFLVVEPNIFSARCWASFSTANKTSSTVATPISMRRRVNEVKLRPGHYGRALEDAISTHKNQWAPAWEQKSPLSGGASFTSMTPTERVSVCMLHFCLRPLTLRF